MAEKSEFQVKILSENAVLYYGFCKVLFVPTGQEEIAILPFHTPLIGLVGEGAIRINSENGLKTITEVKNGIVHFSDNAATVLVNA